LNIKLTIYDLKSKSKKTKDIVINDEETFVIGRTIGDLLLDDVKSSKRHCSISFNAKKLSLTDLDSSNGTLVNDLKISKVTVLKSGDVFKIGSHKIQVNYAQVTTINTVKFNESESGFFDNFTLIKIAEEYYYTYKGFRDQPLRFFYERGYKDQLAKSLLFLFINFLLIGISSFSFEGAIVSSGTFFFFIAIAKFLELTKFITHIKGSFSQYVAFFSVFSIITVPISICSNLPDIGGVAGIIELLCMLWGIYTFWRAFEYKIFRMLILQTFVITLCLFGFTYFAPESYRRDIPSIESDILQKLIQ
jgi:hypothetical protein